MRRALALALLLALPALPSPGAQAQVGCVMSLPSLTIVCAPAHSVGDFWSYHSRFQTENGTIEQNETLSVEALEDFQGSPAERLKSVASQFIPAPGTNLAAASYSSTNNRTSWIDRATQAVLRIEHEQSETQNNSFFRVLTVTWTNWTFHQPQNLYKFPLVRDDAWVVITNATITKETTSFSHVAGGNQTRVERPGEIGNISQGEGKQWLRECRTIDPEGPNCEGGLKTPAGTFDAVVIAGVSGNITIFDFWAPATGQLARREFRNQNGTFLGATELTGYRFANAPTPVERPPPSPGGTTDLRLVGAAAGAGVLAGLVGVAVWRRRAHLQEPGVPPEPGAPPAPSEPPSGEPPPSPPEPPS